MPVIAVINRKGGSGKSTLATHLAAWCATHGLPVMLGDVDRQQSTQTWLRLREKQRPPQAAPIVGWTIDPRNIRRPPPGITRVVLDTPGGMRGTDLARVVMYADAILMPVGHSVFDRVSAAACHAELMSLPRVASGRCKVAAIGMRLDARTKAAELLQEWAGRLNLPFIGVLRETQVYVRCVERGLTLFDLPPAQSQADLTQWKPILDWLDPLLHPAIAEVAAPAAVQRSSNLARATPEVAAKALDELAARRPQPALRASSRRDGLGRSGRLLDWLVLPRLFRRNS